MSAYSPHFIALWIPTVNVFSFRPDLFDFYALTGLSPHDRLNHAFRVAREHLGIAPLLDPEGMFITSTLYAYLLHSN